MVVNSRIAYIDAARALGAMFVIVLHSAAGYLKNPVPEWPRYGAQYNIGFDYLSSAIHMFTMPVFFFIAGFFAHNLLAKLGVWGFIKNRSKRILLPFIALLFLFNLGILLNNFFHQKIHSVSDVLLCFKNLSYLWFLEYLIIYYVLYLVIAWLKPIRLKSEVHTQLITHWVHSKWNGFPIIFINITCLYFCHAWFTPIHVSFIPSIWLLSLYAIYFFMGIIITKQNLIKEIFTLSPWEIFFAVLSYFIYLYIMVNKQQGEIFRILAIINYSFASYVLFVGLFALCIKYFSNKNKVLHLVANASYWMYLSQVFFIISIHKLLQSGNFSIFAQFTMMCGVTFTLSLFTYWVFCCSKQNITKHKETQLKLSPSD